MHLPADDLTLGVILLVVGLPAIIGLGYVIVRFQHWRHARAWKPLLATVQGRVQPIVGGGAESRMRGRYQGYDIVAGMTPKVSSDECNEFSVAIVGVAGASDWTVTGSSRSLRDLWPGAASPPLRVESSDEGLRARLEIEGVVSLAEQMGVTSDDPDPPVRYACSSQSLTIQCVLGNTWVPSEGEFIEMLDCLVHLARINNRVNSPLA